MAPSHPAVTTASVTQSGERLSVAGTLDFTTARDVLGQVAPVIAATPSLTVDLKDVSRSNSAGLALMIEWLALATRAGHSLRFANVPNGLVQLARVCQVERLITPDASA